MRAEWLTPRRILLTLWLIVVVGVGFWEVSQVIDNFSSQWGYIPLAIVYACIINDIFCHRVCAHRLYEVDPSRWTYKILTFLASVDLGYGPVRDIVLWHTRHHIYSDRGPEDVMNWRHYWWSTAAVTPLRFCVVPVATDKDTRYFDKQFRNFGKLLKDPWTKFCNNWSLEISVIAISLTYFLCTPLFKILVIGRVAIMIITGFSGIFGHMKNFPGSYRNFNTRDTTSNNLLFYYTSLLFHSGTLQNNHHARQNTIAQDYHWYEFDLGKYVIYLLRHLIGKKK